MAENIILQQIINQYRDKPHEIPLFIIDRLCAKFHLARIIVLAYDSQLKAPASTQQADLQVIVELLWLVVRWNYRHRDLKVLNAIITAVQRFSVHNTELDSCIKKHRDELLCSI